MVTRYKPVAYKSGRWQGFPSTGSFGVKSKANKFVSQVKKSYKQADLKPPRMKVVRIRI